MPRSAPAQVFLCHALADRVMVLEIENYLAPLVDSGALVLLGPHRQLGGDEAGEYRSTLAGAQLILLFVSPDLMSSCTVDMQLAVSQFEAGAAKVLPILLRPTGLIEFSPIQQLQNLILRPEGKSIAQNPSRDVAWQIVVETIEARIRSAPAADAAVLRRRVLPYDEGQLFGLAMLNPQVLRCNRDKQWGRATSLLANARSCIILLPGEAGQAHTYFEQRIARLLPVEPPRLVVDVDWTGGAFPCSEPEYRDALVHALGLSRLEELVPELRKRLCHRDLVILHPAVKRNFEREEHAPALFAYYTQWLPKLLKEVQGQRTVKCVQPIAWPIVSAWRRTLAQKLRPFLSPRLRGWLCLGPTGRAAQRWIKRLHVAGHADLPVFLLTELQDIDEELLADYCKQVSITPERHAEFITEITGDAVTSEDRLRAIAHSLDKYISITAEAPHGR